MTERIRFHFDPICPWCYQTSRWIKRLEGLGDVELSWGLFSLEVQNAGDEPEELAEMHARSELGLRTAVAVRDAGSSDALGTFYSALGKRVHEGGEPLGERSTVEGALEDAGLDPALCEKAMRDDSTRDRVIAEHRDLVDRTRSFGVPTVVLDDGEGPAIFGPVIREVPSSDEEARELLHHVIWLARYENFAELKRDRGGLPDLESIRRWKRQQEERSSD